jgi:hypothetical protein
MHVICEQPPAVLADITVTNNFVVTDFVAQKTLLCAARCCSRQATWQADSCTELSKQSFQVEAAAATTAPTTVSD